MEARGQAFQDLFADIMEKSHPGDFHRVKPWGRLGDLKNDGYLTSERLLFQVYAPSALAATQTNAKMEADFEGAQAVWAPYCSGWVFVTSEHEGLPAPVELKLLELGARYDGVTVASWGYEELRSLVFELSDADITALLGPAPSMTDVVDVRYADLEPVLEGIAARLTGRDLDLSPVNAGKLDANGLSDWVKLLLSGGIQGSNRVADYFHDHFSPTKGDEVARAFAGEYISLRDQAMPPDDIFTGLRVYAGGGSVLPPRLEAALLALLAYLFERCDIYEPARSATA